MLFRSPAPTAKKNPRGNTAPSSVIKALESDFLDTNSREGNISQEDIQFVQMLNENVHHNKEGHVEKPLPFRERPLLPNNKRLATVPLKHLKGQNGKKSKIQGGLCEIHERCF